MNKIISKNFNAIEVMKDPNNIYSVRYRYNKKNEYDIITNEDFTQAIEQMGGFVYNTAVGQIGKVTIINGYTWVSVSGLSTSEACDKWLKILEKNLFCTVK